MKRKSATRNKGRESASCSFPAKVLEPGFCFSAVNVFRPAQIETDFARVQRVMRQIKQSHCSSVSLFSTSAR